MSDRPRLRQALGSVSTFAIGLNCVIGSGIFLLPGRVAEVLGPAALIAFLIATVLCALVVLCFAEVGSRFEETGGPMVYSRAAFGEFAGFQIGWLSWASRVTSTAALSHGFVDALATLLPGAENLRATSITAVFLALAWINLRGVASGARVMNAFTVAKLLPMVAFVLLGAFFIDTSGFTPFAPRGLGGLGSGTVLILYAYVGFESLTIPAGEMRAARRSVPGALISVLITVTVLYLAIWAVCAGTLPGLAGSANPVGEAAERFLGSFGGGLIQLGILMSLIGINATMALVTPRALFALAEARWLPAWLGRVHPSTGAPAPAILVSAAIGLGVALTGNFEKLAMLSVVGRLAQYVATCLAMMRLRARPKGAEPSFRVPGGPTVPLAAIALCGWLLYETESGKLIAGAIAVAVGAVVFAVGRATLGRERGTSP